MHRNDCKRLRIELKRKKKDQVAKAKEGQSDPLLPMKDEEVNDGDDGEEKTTKRQETEKEKQKKKKKNKKKAKEKKTKQHNQRKRKEEGNE